MGRKPKVDTTPDPIDLDPHDLEEIEAGKDLTHQEKVFCYEYIRHGHVIQCVEAAGYNLKNKSQKGNHLLTLPHIQRYIAAITKKHLDKYDVTEEKVIQEIAAVAFQDIKDVVQDFNEQGIVFKPLNQIDGRTVSAIEYSPMGESGYGTTKVKRPDKLRALHELLTHLQRVKEYENPNPTMSVTPDDLNSMDASKAARSYQDLIRAMQQKK